MDEPSIKMDALFARFIKVILDDVFSCKSEKISGITSFIPRSEVNDVIQNEYSKITPKNIALTSSQCA